MRDADALLALNQGFIAAVRDSDVAWFERHLDADFFNSNADGTFVDRATFLRQIAAPCPVARFAVEDVRIQPLGDAAAIARGRTTYLKRDGEPGSGRYTDLWIRRGAEWRCVSADVSRG